jgi:hypothetical protein
MSIDTARRQLLLAISQALSSYGMTDRPGFKVECEKLQQSLERAIDGLIVERIRGARSLPQAELTETAPGAWKVSVRTEATGGPFATPDEAVAWLRREHPTIEAAALKVTAAQQPQATREKPRCI